MVDIKIIPPHILRLYAWEVLELNDALSMIDDYIPVIPIEDEPKLADSGKSYIIYGWAEHPDPNYEIRRGTFSMRVIGRTFGELGHIINILTRAFEAGDQSAEHVNLWSSSFNDNQLVGIRFTNLDIGYVEGGSAPEQEGGPSEGLVNVSYRYITHQTIQLPEDSLGGLWTPDA